ncbi:hypothetical protein NLI96_g11200 [Meripilus lineatus]|uniref:Uncharacterized protein n=1 Tax=Meripilus lineatus TaxID=2056292 RepID=A0AAD5US67_9APHY|nr:hypothetical protein NLI96_g11200 [Physisporinus lineatus]
MDDTQYYAAWIQGVHWHVPFRRHQNGPKLQTKLPLSNALFTGYTTPSQRPSSFGTAYASQLWASARRAIAAPLHLHDNIFSNLPSHPSIPSSTPLNVFVDMGPSSTPLNVFVDMGPSSPAWVIMMTPRVLRPPMMHSQRPSAMHPSLPEPKVGSSSLPSPTSPLSSLGRIDQHLHATVDPLQPVSVF